MVYDGRPNPGVELLVKPPTEKALAKKVRSVLGEPTEEKAVANSSARPGICG
jgi:hypothetical protein